ncbi:MAG: hypothetical protein DDT22_01333 [candidate division WS2 bacterium]|nr:hypothetical protein [Candidatus Lithacetigena glycinireducens]
MNQLTSIIKKNKKLVQFALDSLKPLIIKEIGEKLSGKITGSSILAVKLVIEKMKI